MKSDFKVATSAALALLAAVVTVEIGGHRGAGPACLHSGGGTIQTKICAQRSIDKIEAGVRKSVTYAGTQSASLQLGRLDLITSAVLPIHKRN